MDALVKCPSCRYEIPPSGGTCPECGQRWTREELLLAAGRAVLPVTGLVWELRLAAAGGTITALGMAACAAMAGQYAATAGALFLFLLGLGLAAGSWWLMRRIHPDREAGTVPLWAAAKLAHVLGVTLLLLGLAGAALAGLSVFLCFVFFVQGANP